MPVKRMGYRNLSDWRQPLLEAICITLFVLGLFFYWFGVANRHAVFLYDHVAVGIPGAEPFDAMTRSRYWMAGLVASGAVMVLYVVANWGWAQWCGRRGICFTASMWWRTWPLCTIPLIVGIPAITMTMNAPTLPPYLAAATVVATLGGLALALLPGSWAAECQTDLAWLAVDAVGLMPALLLLRVVELPVQGLSVSPAVAWTLAIGGLVAGAVWLVGMSWLRLRWQRAMPGAGALFLAGLGLSYVLLPLVHHLLATPPGYRYISTASNFFAFNWAVQCMAIAVAVVMAICVTCWRCWLIAASGKTGGITENEQRTRETDCPSE